MADETQRCSAEDQVRTEQLCREISTPPFISVPGFSLFSTGTSHSLALDVFCFAEGRSAALDLQLVRGQGWASPWLLTHANSSPRLCAPLPAAGQPGPAAQTALWLHTAGGRTRSPALLHWPITVLLGEPVPCPTSHRPSGCSRALEWGLSCGVVLPHGRPTEGPPAEGSTGSSQPPLCRVCDPCAAR